MLGCQHEMKTMNEDVVILHEYLDLPGAGRRIQ